MRYFYLLVVIVASITLWYQYFIPPSVGQILIVKFHMSFRFFLLTIILSNIAGVVSALAGHITDRIGRTWVVIGGLGIVALVQLFAFPNVSNKAELAVVTAAVGLFEGIILVATPALVRDFTPQLGRASAMGFWTLGPVAGLLVATLLAAHTLSLTSGDWQRQFIISGIVGLIVFGIALAFLRELSPKIRDQVMVTERDRMLVEMKARGVDVASALKNPWRQMARFDVLISAVAIAVMLVLFYTAAGTFPTAFFVTVFAKATSFSALPQANGIAAWMWAADCIALVVFGILSDLVRVRKPFMIVGSLGMLVLIPILIHEAGNVTSPTSGSVTSYGVVALTCAILFAFQAMAYSTWMASFTETCEAHNPALIGTGLSIWGGLVRLTTVLTYLFIPFLLVSAGTAANNAYQPMTPANVRAVNAIVAHRTPSISDIMSTHPQTEVANIAPPASIIMNRYPHLVSVVQSDPKAFAQAANYPGTSLISANPPLFHRVLRDAGGSVATLQAIQRIKPELTFLNKYESSLTKLIPTRQTAPREWQHWLWGCFGCAAFFIPFVFVMKGRWSPRRARQDQRDHDAFVNEELAQLRNEGSSVTA